MFLTLLYNLLMAAVVGAALFALFRLRTTWVWVKICADVVLAAFALAGVLALAAGQAWFGVFRLTAYGLFLHGIVVLIGSALLLRRDRPKTATVSALLAVLVGAFALDAFLIEPTWLEVTRVRITTSKLTKPVRIVVLADLQTDRIGRYEREVFLRAMLEEPDMILLGGDYLQAAQPLRQELVAELNAFLRQIDFAAPKGVFAVRGNIDADDWPATFAGLPVTVVRRTQSFDVAGLRLTCLSAADSFNPALEVSAGASGRFHLVLGHSPDFALGRIGADLLVAGHTHGGQVRLPLLGPPVTFSRLPNRHSAGLLDLPGGARVYVSRGIGMERGNAPRLRFLCRPELTVLELVPQ